MTKQELEQQRTAAGDEYAATCNAAGVKLTEKLKEIETALANLLPEHGATLLLKNPYPHSAYQNGRIPPGKKCKVSMDGDFMYVMFYGDQLVWDSWHIKAWPSQRTYFT